MKNIIVIISILLVITSCSTNEIIPDAPNLSNSNYPELSFNDKTTSSVVLPIEISLNSILSKINSSIPKQITFNEVIDCPETPLPQEEHCKINGYVNIGAVNLSGEGGTFSASTTISGQTWTDLS